MYVIDLESQGQMSLNVKYIIYFNNIAVFVCMCVFMYVCMYVYIYICTYIYLYIYIYINVCICIYIYIYICVCVFVHVCVCILVCKLCFYSFISSPMLTIITCHVLLGTGTHTKVHAWQASVRARAFHFCIDNVEACMHL